MDFTTFEQNARKTWDEIPADYKDGVDGLIAVRSVRTDSAYPDVFTMGECVTQPYPSQYGGPDTTRSAVVLYYGSFEEIARESEDFDWHEEIRETITHELQHHLESLADDDTLEDLDYAVDENFKRLQKEPFDPLFYRAGEAIDDGIYSVESDLFLEVVSKETGAMPVEFELDGVLFRVHLPAAHADVTFVHVDEIIVVRVVQRGAFATLRKGFGGITVDSTTAVAEII
jgi:predicted Zn-dependent protease with MMP-like domain